ncbi:hypothetical protein, partial [Nonomuraea turkmeniaca]|uniref:hypothetical protein n=1 Tax=Nonomuraea turkmeniaca TaxID=103838 RepID=UPI001B85F1B3
RPRAWRQQEDERDARVSFQDADVYSASRRSSRQGDHAVNIGPTYPRHTAHLAEVRAGVFSDTRHLEFWTGWN